MLVTVAGTVATHNLAIGVGLGVLTAMVVFARRVAHLSTSTASRTPTARPHLLGQGRAFFASDQELIDVFDFAADPRT